MARKRHTPDQILAKLRDADVLLAQGASVADVIRKLEVSEQTYHRWRNQFGGMKGEEMKRLKELECENAQLNRLVAEQALDNRMLKDLAEGDF
ncbi:MAG: transposase [Planctomycetota bacterium]